VQKKKCACPGNCRCPTVKALLLYIRHIEYCHSNIFFPHGVGVQRGPWLPHARCF